MMGRYLRVPYVWQRQQQDDDDFAEDVDTLVYCTLLLYLLYVQSSLNENLIKGAIGEMVTLSRLSYRCFELAV